MLVKETVSESASVTKLLRLITISSLSSFSPGANVIGLYTGQSLAAAIFSVAILDST